MDCVFDLESDDEEAGLVSKKRPLEADTEDLPEAKRPAVGVIRQTTTMNKVMPKVSWVLFS